MFFACGTRLGSSARYRNAPRRHALPCKHRICRSRRWNVGSHSCRRRRRNRTMCRTRSCPAGCTVRVSIWPSNLAPNNNTPNNTKPNQPPHHHHHHTRPNMTRHQHQRRPVHVHAFVILNSRLLAARAHHRPAEVEGVLHQPLAALDHVSYVIKDTTRIQPTQSRNYRW